MYTESMSEEDRGRGILTPADRAYLADPEQYSRQAQYNRNQAIRKRVGNALLDVPILVDGLSHDVWEEALSLTEVDSDPAAHLPALVSLLYQFHGSEYQLERLVEAGVEHVRREQGDPVKARVSVDLFPDEMAELKQRLAEDGVDAVSDREIEDLWEAGELGDDEYITLVKRWQERWEPDRYDEVAEDYDVAEYEHKEGRRVVHGAVNRAKQNVELAQRREESRTEWLEGLYSDDERAQ